MLHLFLEVVVEAGDKAEAGVALEEVREDIIEAVLGIGVALEEVHEDIIEAV